MKVKVTKFEETEKIIDIEVPHYYKMDYGQFENCNCGHTITYGKITRKNVLLCVQKTENKDGSCNYEISTSIYNEIAGYDEDIFSEKCKSTKKEFVTAWSEMHFCIDEIEKFEHEGE